MGGGWVACHEWYLYHRDIEPERETLYRYCQSVAGDPPSAEDLLQETLLRGFLLVGSLWKGMDSPRAYLKRVARNLHIDRQRRDRRCSAGEVPASVEELGSTAVEMTMDQQMDWLRRSLPPAELRAFILRELFGYTFPEIARMTESTVAAVKMACSRARRRLARDPD
ncbi:MAG: RNA polymerase sigma factor [Myxococcota bacterium]